ncbi:MAG: serine/threonine-protein kinase [Acidobacteriota bacterium]
MPNQDGTVSGGSTPERWRRVREIFDGAIELDAARRSSYLDAECAGDDSLRGEVEGLLDAAGDPLPWLEEPVLAEAVDHLAQSEEERAAGGLLGPYRLEEPLGRGGMGTVYLASRADGQYRQQVAVKLMRGRMAGGLLEERFRAERQILADLAHPNIARLLDGGVTPEGEPYLVMERVEGEPIDRYLDRCGANLVRRIEVFLGVCGALQHAHRHLVVHCDLKPGNILVTSDGEPKLLDFGIARWLAPERGGRPEPGGPRWATEVYASPEQMAGGPVATASDVYSLGVLLHLLLAGTLPVRPAGGDGPSGEVEVGFVAMSRAVPSDAGVAAARGARPGRLRRALRGDLDSIVAKALRTDVRRRYGSVEALAEDLRRHLDGRPVLARGPSTAYATGRFLRRRWPAVLAVSLVVSSLVLGLWAARSEARKAEHERRKAERVTGFVEALFREVDPAHARGTELTVDDWLKDAEGPIRSGLAGQPEVQAELLRILGQGYRSLGRLEDARGLLDEALALRSGLGRPPETARELDALGLLLLDEGNLEAAEEQVRLALDLRREHFGDDHPEVAESLNSLGRVHLAQGNPAAAEPHLRRSLDIRRRTLGPDSREVSVGLNNLGVLLVETGRLTEGRRALEEALTLRRQRFGGRHLLVANSLHNLASLLTDLGEGDAAEAHQREALDIYRERLGSEHAATAAALYNLARVQRTVGDVASARSTAAEAVGVYRQLQNPADLASGLMLIGVLAYGAGDLVAAEDAIGEALGLRREHLGVSHPAFAGSLYSLLRVLGDLGDSARAAAELDAALAAWGSAPPPREWDLPYAEGRRAALAGDGPGLASAIDALQRGGRADLAAQLEDGG